MESDYLVRRSVAAVMLACAGGVAAAAGIPCAGASGEQQLTYSVAASAAGKAGTPGIVFDAAPVRLLEGDQPHNFYAYTTVWKTTDRSAFNAKEGSLAKGPGKLDVVSKSGPGRAEVKLLAEVDTPVLLKASTRSVAKYSPKDPLSQSVAQASFVRTFTLAPFTSVTFELAYDLAAELDEVQSAANVPSLEPAVLAVAWLGTGTPGSDGVARPEYTDRQLEVRRNALSRESNGERRAAIGTISRTFSNDSDRPTKGFVTSMVSLEAFMNVGQKPVSTLSDILQDSTHAPTPPAAATGPQVPVTCRD